MNIRNDGVLSKGNAAVMYDKRRNQIGLTTARMTIKISKTIGISLTIR
jgi:hypothetical protein